jgi:hypothetical protein
LVSRPNAADEYCNEVCQTLVHGKQSITALIMNSHDFQGWLQTNCESCESELVVTSLSTGTKKHRFDTTQKPTALAVLQHEGRIKTAMQISAIRRGSSEALCADYFLLYISGTLGIRRCLMLSMLAEAGDEGMLPVRKSDKEMPDPSDVAFTLDTFVRHVQYLFLEGNCVKHGYVKHMIKRLCRPIVFTVKGHALQCGSPTGPSTEDIEFCMDHMKCWARMSIATARAEFPEFTLLSAMRVFKLNGKDVCEQSGRDPDAVVGYSECDTEQLLGVLASAFDNIDFDELVMEFPKIQNIAQNLKRTNRNLTDAEAWRTACLRVETSQAKQSSANTKALVMRRIAWCIGTGNIERAFSVVQAHFSSARRGCMTRQREQDILTLTYDYDPSEEDEIIALAIGLWNQFYFNVRKPPTLQRLDAGIARGAKVLPRDPKTLPAFVAKRRSDVASAVSQRALTIVSKERVHELTEGVWDGRMAKEELHMQNKRAMRLVENIANGLRPSNDVDLGGMTPEQITRIYRLNEERLQKDRDKVVTLKSLCFAIRLPTILHGKSVMMASNIAMDDQLTRVSSKLSLRTIKCVWDVDMFIMTTLDDVKESVKLWLFLAGGCLVQREYVMSEGLTGTGLVYNAAVHTPCKEIWASASWVLKHPVLFGLLDRALSRPGSRWKWFIGSNVEFVTRGIRTPKQLTGLVTGAEKKGFPANFHNAVTTEAFIANVCSISTASQTALSSGVGRNL